CVALLGMRLPELGRYLCKGVAEFRRGMEEYREEIDDVTAARVRRVLATALGFCVLLTVAVCLLGRGPWWGYRKPSARGHQAHQPEQTEQYRDHVEADCRANCRPSLKVAVLLPGPVSACAEEGGRGEETYREYEAEQPRVGGEQGESDHPQER